MYFVIECPIDDDKSPSAFSELLRDYIKLETEKEPDLLDVGWVSFPLNVKCLPDSENQSHKG